MLHALDGYDEISLTGNFKVKTHTSDRILSPADLGMKTVNQEDIYGGDTREDAASIFLHVLKGAGTPAQQSVVSANAAIAIQTCAPGLSLADAVSAAEESVKSGRAFQSFKNLIEATA